MLRPNFILQTVLLQFLLLCVFVVQYANADFTENLKLTSFSKLVNSDHVTGDLDRQIWNRREDMLKGVLDNLNYLTSDSAHAAYQHSTSSERSRMLVLRSLDRFFELLLYASNYEEFQRNLRNEFHLFRSKGNDGVGTVKFTGYYRPVYQASRTRSKDYPYPLFTLPDDFTDWSAPHPTRVALESFDGKGQDAALMNGNELAFLKSRFDVFMVHVQGSAILEFEDGEHSAIGFAGGTDYPFTGISKSFLRKYNVKWHKLHEFFARKPELLDQLLSKNNRFIFFKESEEPQAIGSLGVPVIAELSIATDKIKLPPGALGIVRAPYPFKNKFGRLQVKSQTRIVIDHDTGSAIKGPGRVDLYMGTGDEAMERASSIYGNGELYYLFLKSALKRLSQDRG